MKFKKEEVWLNKEGKGDAYVIEAVMSIRA